MYSTPKYMRILYRIIQLSAVFFIFSYAYLEDYNRVMDQVLIFILVSTLLRLSAHVNVLIEHNTFLIDFFYKIAPVPPEEAEAEDCKDTK